MIKLKNILREDNKDIVEKEIAKLSGGNPKLKKVALAYADVWMDPHRGMKYRNLNFKGDYLSGQEFLDAVKKFIPDPDGYNEFDLSVAKNIVKTFGNGNVYGLGRENSVVLYIKHDVGNNKWFTGDISSSLPGLKYQFKADAAREQKNGTIKFWWD